MPKTLEDALKASSSYVDQENTVPSGTDLATRTAYANRALNEWSDFTDWEDLTSAYLFTGITEGATTLSLPATFRKPMGPLAVYTGTTPTLYKLIPRDERFSIDSTGNYCYLEGNLDSGYNLTVPKGLTSGASCLMDIQSFPTSLLSLCSVIPTKSSDYVAQRIISLVLESRGDDRFPIAKADADRKLYAMAEAQNAKNIGTNNQIPMNKTWHMGE